mmetsp:Transcript_20057/g.25851  ORF Transcript_20057/g.25851 Transcript_20057/m.25851 type:complete len:298 (+) Transcript_20057:38-931(+)
MHVASHKWSSTMVVASAVISRCFLRCCRTVMALKEKSVGTYTAAQRPDIRGRYPLHIACQCSQPLSTIEILLIECPRTETNAECHELVHLAIAGIGGNHYNKGVDESMQRDCQIGTGSLPTSLRLFHLDAILYLLEQFPVQVWEHGLKDYYQRGSLPLHSLLTKKGTSIVSEEEKAMLVHKLVDTYPDSVYSCHHEFRLPLVQACTRGNPAIVINHLTGITEDGKQQPPSAFVLQHYPNLQTIVYVGSLYPNVVFETLNDKNQLPLHLACLWGHCPTSDGEEMDSGHNARVLAFLRK